MDTEKPGSGGLTVPGGLLYKAVDPNGNAFYDGQFAWGTTPGDITTHPDYNHNSSYAGEYLSVATAATDCTGFRWPARLLVVEAVGDTHVPDVRLPHKVAGQSFLTVEERPAHELLGPQGEHVAALIDRLRHLTPTEALALADAARAAAWDAAWDAARDAARAAARDAAWDAAWAAAWDAAWDAARDAAWAAARDAAWDAARDAAWAAAWDAAGLLVRDLIDDETYGRLTEVVRRVLGPIHPDDEPVTVEATA